MTADGAARRVHREGCPAGLVVAHLLQRAGISFVVVERQEAGGLRARVKARMIEHRTVELLTPHGLAGRPSGVTGGSAGASFAPTGKLSCSTSARHQEFTNLMLSLFNADGQRRTRRAA